MVSLIVAIDQWFPGQENLLLTKRILSVIL